VPVTDSVQYSVFRSGRPNATFVSDAPAARRVVELLAQLQ
jgi:hypothetical protein